MRPETLHTLLDLRKAACDRAGRALAEAQKAEDRARAQLRTLDTYRTTYAGQRTAAGTSGVNVAVLRNDIGFAKQLDDAIATARGRVSAAVAAVATKTAEWRAAERTRLAYETLSKRQAAEAADATGRAEQRGADARTTAAFARKRQQQLNPGESA